MAERNLMEKTELTVRGIRLWNVDLARVAEAAADTLGLERSDVLVTDVQESQLTIDLLQRGLDPRAVVGKERELLRRLSRLPGIHVPEGATVASRGMLSWISLESEEGNEVLRRSERMARNIRQVLERTAIVFSTGAEVANGQVMDTNAPAIRERLHGAGYRVKFGGTLKDDEELIAARLRQAAEDGYGLILTTGGVGAEDKDRTIEGVLKADPDAVAPSIVQYQIGVGRHRRKDCVRIAVGEISRSLIVALPGPNDEVRIGVDALIKGLGDDAGKEVLAEKIASRLRERLKEKAREPGGRDCGGFSGADPPHSHPAFRGKE